MFDQNHDHLSCYFQATDRGISAIVSRNRNLKTLNLHSCSVSTAAVNHKIYFSAENLKVAFDTIMVCSCCSTPTPRPRQLQWLSMG